MTHAELARAYERGEINFAEYMETALQPEKFNIKRARRNGRKLAAAQGAAIAGELYT